MALYVSEWYYSGILTMRLWVQLLLGARLFVPLPHSHFCLQLNLSSSQRQVGSTEFRQPWCSSCHIFKLG